MWTLVVNKLLDLSNVYVLDVGAGTGKLYDLITKLGANPENILALEPNADLAYLLSNKKIPTILGNTDDLHHDLLQKGEIGLLTANMVVNHLTTEEYCRFIQFSKDVLGVNGVLIYTIPFPEGKGNKHKIDISDDNVVVEENAPWGGKVKYHHRSDAYQVKILQENGFAVDRFLFGYESFVSDNIIRAGERVRNKSLRGYKREMFIAKRVG